MGCAIGHGSHVSGTQKNILEAWVWLDLTWTAIHLQIQHF